MEWENDITESSNKFPIWIIVILIIMLCICLGTVGLIGVMISSDEFQDTINEAFNDDGTLTPVPSVSTSENVLVEGEAVQPTAVSTLSASASKNTPAPFVPNPIITTNSASLQTAIAPYIETDITTLPPIYTNDTEGMKHNLDDYIKTISADVDTADFVADAVFVNPFAVDENSWDIGYGFRREEIGDELWIVISSEGEWELINRTNGEGEEIDFGVFNGRINTNADESNRLTLITQGKKGHFLLNNELVTRLDLSSRTNSGKVMAATAYYTGHEVEGAVTKVENFTIWAMDSPLLK